MCTIRQASYILLANEFSKHSHLPDLFWRLRGALDNTKICSISGLLDTNGHLENILKEIDEVIYCNLDVNSLLEVDLTCFTNRFFLRLAKLTPQQPQIH